MSYYDPIPSWEPSADALAEYATAAAQSGGDNFDNRGFDDMFDSGIFRTSRALYQAQGHVMAPRGQTALRKKGAVTHELQAGPLGIPAERAASFIYSTRAPPPGGFRFRDLR